MRYSVAANVLALVAAGTLIAAHADTCLRYKSTTPAFTVAGKAVPEKVATTTIWIGKSAARSDDGVKSGVIVDIAKSQILALDMVNKTYTVMPLADIAATVNTAIDQATPQGNDAAAAMVRQMTSSMMQMKMTVTPTGELKKIGNYSCTHYKVAMTVGPATTASDVWTTEDISADMKLFSEVRNGLLASMPGYADVVSESAKMKGVAVLSTSTVNVMGSTVTTTEELLEQASKPAPAGTFGIPAGYQERKAAGK